MTLEKRKPYLLLVWLFIISTFSGYGQALEANHWYFGYGAGLIFQPNGPKPDLNGKQRSTYSVATISDNVGELLFYADQNSIFTNTHDTMNNGINTLNSNNLLIVQEPQSSNLYWLFSIEKHQTQFNSRCHYHIIDISRNGGQGEVVRSGVLPGIFASRGMTICDHSNGIDKWLLFKQDTTKDVFQAMLLTKNGIQQASAVQSSFQKLHPRSSLFMKASPNSQYISTVYRYPRNEVSVYRFNRSTGVIVKKIYSNSIAQPGNEILFTGFTPNSEITIVSRRNKLLAYDISSEDSATIQSSELLVDSNPRVGDNMLDMQIGLDGNLYFLNGTFEYQRSKKISRILCPDNIYQQIIIEDTVIGPLGLVLGNQLPTLNQTLYVNTHKLQAQSQGDTTLCRGDTTELTAYGAAMDDFYWSPSGSLSCTNCQSPIATPDTTTTYRVIGIARSCTQDNMDTAYVTVYVNPPKGKGKILGDTVICGNQPATLEGPKGFDNYWWLIGLPDRKRSITTPGTYQLRVESKCYVDTLTQTVTQGDTLEYTFPEDTTLCPKDFPITLEASSNAPIYINGSLQQDITMSSAASVTFFSENSCGKAEKTVRVDTITLPVVLPDTALPDSVKTNTELTLPVKGYAVLDNDLRTFAPGKALKYGIEGEVELFQIRGAGSCTDTILLKTIKIYKEENPVVENVPCKLSVSPNPGAELFELTANQELQNIGVYDSRGQLLYGTDQPTETPFVFFSEGWSVGTYVIQATCKDTEVLRVKWIKR